ncbi:NiFe hydrogenase [Shewanella sp. C32]|uniref:NiFe hydrogenase n=1 Tax=Shewanella electrica TaxID=515560 RepID=A0ABT2FKY1_9GAMM|nr:NiFe hydrogenase [Shewanella electrica]MCH1923750.1 NiFe hydrogenase [Shewanella electrica]MCS4556968.1 NiFe hydrogenase [Shewanella electrica]
MKLLRFEFDCSRQVPWYGHLCNQYLNYQPLTLTVGLQAVQVQGDAALQQLPITWRYFIEAEGEQAPLEALANALAQDFLISTYLLESRIIPIEQRLGSDKPLADNDATLAFCQHCQPQFGDNQHANFATLNLPCTHCHGDAAINAKPALAALQPADLVQLAKQLLDGNSITLTDVIGDIQLSRTPIANDDCAVLICNPNTLSQQFVLENRQVLSLSSLEKPLLILKPQAELKLAPALLPVGFAATRLQQVLCELLRVKGVDWIYISGAKRPVFANILSADVPVRANTSHLSNASTGVAVKEPLHDDVRFGAYVAHSGGSRKQPVIDSSLSDADVWDSTNAAYAAECAALGLAAEFAHHTNYAVLYFSRQFDSKIITCDSKGSFAPFITLPKLPSSGKAVADVLQQSEHAAVWQKFVAKHPEIEQRLFGLDLASVTKVASLEALWAVAAVIVGIQADNAKALAQAFIAAAMSNRSANSPRIDFPLTQMADNSDSSFVWSKALGSLVSFRLAGDEDEAKLAFAMNDSLADFIANWIERLDLNVGIKCVYLAGDEFANPVLVKRLGLRLGKNFPMASSQQQDLDGSLLATGALYLRQRRGK